MRIVTTDEARRQIEEADEWWRANRDNPDLFASEYERALEHLKAAPESGKRVRKVRGRLIRRWPLKKSRYHVYYWHDPATEVLVIRTIWSATRGHGPPL